MDSETDLRWPSSTLGLAVGLLMGYSVSPVVNGVITSILAGAFVVLSIAPESSKGSIGKAHLRAIPFFSIAIILGASLGLYLKSNNTLFPSPIQIEYNNLIAIGIEDSDAQAAVLQKYLGGTNENGSTTGLNATSQMGRKSAVLSIAEANSGIRAAALNVEENEVKRFLETQFNRIALNLKNVMEDSIGLEASQLWFEFYVADPSEQLRKWQDIEINHPDEFEKIVEFLHG